MRLTPNPEQEESIEYLLASPTRTGLLAGAMGSGKTLMATEVALRRSAEVVVVIAPLSTRTGWERSFRGQGWEHPIHRVDSKKAGKAAFEDLHNDTPGVYLFGREYARKIDWGKLYADILIYDEVHAIQNRKSKGFQNIQKVRAGYKLALSGTPFRNKFEGAWAPTRWLFPEHVDRSFWRWAVRWTRTEYDPFTYNNKKIVGERNPGEYVKSLPCYVRIESNVAEAVTEKRYVELTPAQRKMYNQMEEDMLVWLDENPLVADLPVTQRIRLRQMTLGTVTFDEEGAIDFEPDTKSAKIEALKDILSDLEGEPVLILTDSQKFARVVAHRLGEGAYEYSGKTSQDHREKIVANFGGKVQYIVATIGSVAEGLDGLQRVCHNMVWLSKSEDGVLNDQAMGRLVRTGQTEQVVSYEIIAEETYDDGILGTLLENKLEMRRSLAA